MKKKETDSWNCWGDRVWKRETRRGVQNRRKEGERRERTNDSAHAREQWVPNPDKTRARVVTTAVLYEQR